MPESQTQAAGEASPLDRWLLRWTDWVALLVVVAGCLLRLRAATGTFLNPDEALHFSVANQSSLAAAYHASLTLAHPPLLVLLLYFWRAVGTSEFVLRLPSVIAGTIFCWIFFRWLKATLGSAVGVTGVIFMALLPPLVALTAEVRQYSLLLLFAALATSLLERALSKNSAALMALASTSTCLAVFSNYSGLLFAVALGLYSGLRFLIRQYPARMIAAWAAGQATEIVLIAFLYHVQISGLKNSFLAEWANTEWLRRSYFHPEHDNLAAFVLGRSFAVFQFVFGQQIVGDIAALMFLAGVIFLLQRKFQQPGSEQRLFGIFLLLPFAINCGLAVARRYPYGGTRHSVFLAMFGIAGISVFLVQISRRIPAVAVALAAFVVVACYAFGFHHQPYMTREDQSSFQMDHAVEFIRSQIPAADPIFTDYEASLMLGYHLCRHPAPGEITDPGFHEFSCAGHKIIATSGRVWMFTEETFPESWDELVARYRLKPNSRVWVVHMGWGSSVIPRLQIARDDLRLEGSQLFGRNISVFTMTVH